jgi:molybdopterin molybdotransferase
VVTIGGASVGEHDLIKSALARELVVDFWKIAMRPGKPLVSGTYRGVPMLGLPGNPVSAFVCAQLFIKPAVYRMIGATADPLPHVEAELVVDMPANDARQDYCRARVAMGAGGVLSVSPMPVQDSGMLRALSMAHGLVVRPPHDPPRKVGDRVPVLLLEPLFFG